MKKRLISLLLLFALLVTAMPLSALPLLAAESEETANELTEDDYNNLYVKDDLLFQFDFFQLNSFWNQADDYGTIEVASTGAATETNVINWLNKFIVTDTATPVFRIEHGADYSTDSEGTYSPHIPFHIKDGYVQFKNPTETVRIPPYLQIYFTSGYNVGENGFSMESLISYAGVTPGLSSPLFLPAAFNLYPKITLSSSTSLKISSSGTWSTTYTLASQPAFNHNEKPFMLSYNIETDGTTSSAEIFANGNSLTTATLGKVDGGTTCNIGYYCGSYGMKLYAMRLYDCRLSADEYAQNHFADIAKWFKLDVTEMIGNASFCGKDALNEYYKAFASLSFTSSRDEAQTVADEAYAVLKQSMKIPDISESEYNSLYVKSDLVYSLDFFKLNEYWSPNGHSYVIPTGPSDNKAYYDKATGKTFDFTVANNRFTHTITKTDANGTTTLGGTYLGEAEANAAIALMTPEEGVTYTAVKGTTLHTAWKNAVSEWLTADKNLFSSLTNYTTGAYLRSSDNDFANTTSNDRQNFVRSAIASFGNGYATLLPSGKTYTSGGGLQLLGTSSTLGTLEAVSVLGENLKNDYILFNNIGLTPSKNATAGTYTITGSDTTRAAKLGSIIQSAAFPYNKITTLTYTMSDGNFMMYNGTETVLTATYTGTPSQSYYFGWAGRSTSTKIYAVRYYSDALTAEERAQNHFADIAKYFRLDVEEMIEYSPLCKTEDLNVYYAAFATLDFNSSRIKAQTVADEAYAVLKETIDLPEGSEAEYNALYVADNLVYSLDFFKLNKYWNPEGHSYVIPTGPSDDKAYYDATTGKTFDFTVANNRFTYTVTKTADGSTTTIGTYLGEAEANAAIAKMTAEEGVTYEAVKGTALHAAWKRAVNKWLAADEAFFGSLANYTTGAYLRSCDNDFANTTSNDRQNFVRSSIASLGDGYATLLPSGKTYTSGGGLQLLGTSSTLGTLEAVSVLGENLKNDYILFNNIGLTPSKNATAGTYTITGSDTIRAAKLGSIIQSAAFPYNKITTLTYTMADGNFMMYNGTETVLTATYTGTLSQSYYFNWAGRSTSTKIYAVRYYSDVLTKEERAQNHFADLAKFFRIDLGTFTSYSKAEKQSIYDAFASYTFENTTYVDLQKAYTDFVVDMTVEKYRSHYLEGDEYAAHNAFIDACIAKVEADRGGTLSLDAIYSIPLSERGDIYALSGDSLTQEALTDAIAAYWTFDEEKYNSYDYLYYDEGNLIVAYDFFSLNSYWNADRVTGYLPVSTAVTAWESQTGDGCSYFDRFSVKGSLSLLHETDDIPFTVPAAVHRGNGGFLLLGGNNCAADGFAVPGLGDNTSLTAETVLRVDGASDKLFSLFGLAFGVDKGAYTAPSGMHTLTESKGIGSAAKLGGIATYSLIATHSGLGKTASVSFAVDGSEVLSATGTAMADPADNATFGFEQSFAGALYAIRYYRTALTAEQKAQNHFADIAKFYRLDLQDIDLILCSDEAANTLYAEMADCGFDGQRADIQNIYDSFREAFISENSTLGELRAEANEIVTFEGYQVRIAGTEGEAPNAYAGMRAIFVIDTAFVTALESKGYTVKVDIITRNAQPDHTLRGKPVAIPIYNGESYVAKKQTIDGVGECYVVTVLYASSTDGNRVPLTDERVAELISFEVAYEYALTVTKDGHTYVFTSPAESERFGNTVNAKELYTYFGVEGNDEMQGLHKNDYLVKKMLSLIPEETAIEEARIGKLVLSANAEAQYKVTVPENITDTDLAAIEGFVTELDALTGAEFETVEETATRCDREIVIANGSTRADASEFATASASAGYSYAIGVSGERILVYASDSLALSDALSVLLASVTDNKTDDAKNDNLDKFYLPAMLSVNNSGSSTASVSDFTVILPTSMDAARRTIVNEYIAALAARTGITLTVADDDDTVSGRRILVKTSADNETAAELLANSSYTGYEIIAAGDDILVSAYSDIALRASLSAFVASVSDDGAVPTGVTLKCDFGVGEGVPHLVTNGTLDGGEIYDANENNYTVSYSGVTENEYLAYCDLLDEGGFTKLAENEKNENLFATYKNDGRAVILAFYPSSTVMKITIQTEETFLPTGEAAAYTVNPDVKPSVTLMDHELASYVMQLEDGSFLIVDGGDLNRAGAMDKMWNHLTSLTPAGQKPVISLWMLTHAHQDHMLLMSNFLAEYYGELVLKAVAFNFPNFEALDMSSEDIYTFQGPGIATCAPLVYDVLDRYYPDVERWIPHTGQKHSVAGAEIEILFSHEDSYPMQVAWGNDTSSTWRITLGDTSVVYLGDLTDARSKWMASVYGETLESDILQVTHHGVGGGDLGLYQLVDPKICFWGTSVGEFTGDRCNGTGSYTAYNYNYWLRNSDWTRIVDGEEVSGARAHYHGSVRTTITLPLS